MRTTCAQSFIILPTVITITRMPNYFLWNSCIFDLLLHKRGGVVSTEPGVLSYDQNKNNSIIIAPLRAWSFPGVELQLNSYMFQWQGLFLFVELCRESRVKHYHETRHESEIIFYTKFSFNYLINVFKYCSIPYQFGL